ncbi:LysR family transcriptional regulator [Oceanobacillus polygoni]|uniref:DNA-binding transcriptional LysR family regulator n=1 Tax=Oceanobacillus polygoni TaxID=1235259 RepID=A0A9X0YUP7_9BACI|nr:LysR family transcriptional regulator [Oceanobacillus polygoni]MBP2079200.1 DNA-binding transcriptional LysR family regulator [Oceanobacillus polygoni]
MNLNFIPTFLTIVRKQSISAAAESMHVAQTTISQRLNVAEQEFGFKLIERGRGIKKITLTPAGEEFLRLAEQWENIYNDLKILKEKGPKLTLSIGSIDSFNTFYLPSVYKEINKTSSSVLLRSHTLHSNEIYSGIDNKTLDIGFTLIQRSHSNVNVEKCYESDLVVLRSGNVSDSKVDPLALDPLYELFMPWGEEYKIWHEFWWDPLSVQKIKLDDIHLLFDFLQNPTYWAIVPEWIAKKANKSRGFSIQYFTDPPPKYTCYRLTHKNPSLSKSSAIEFFDNQLKKCISMS